MKESDQSNMFDISLMKHFYDPDHVDNSDVMDAWFKYVYQFLPLVSKPWKDCVKNDRMRCQQIMFQHVTISDEAIVRWFIELWSPKLQKKMDQNWPEENKSTGKGQHDIKKERRLYALIHQSIATQRNNRLNLQNIMIWNQKFWEMFCVAKSDVLAKDDETKPSRSSYGEVDIPLPGMNEDQDFSFFLSSQNGVAQFSVPENITSIQEDEGSNMKIRQV
jgi:hypothetical protein